MKLISWNCRGASSPKFLRCLKDMLSTSRPDILFLMEPRVNSNKGRRILRQFSFSHFIVVEADGFAGGLWCFWKSDELTLEVLNYSDQFINLAVVETNVVKWVLTLVYASPTDEHRHRLWRDLGWLGSVFNMPWCLIGDFNEVLSQEDKKGGRRFEGNNGLNLVMSQCKLMQLPFSGPRYTWTNGRAGASQILEHIDYTFVNEEWSRKFPQALLTHMTRTSSYHHPLMLQLKPAHTQKSGNWTFKFQSCWLEHVDFKDFLKNTWQDKGAPLHSLLSECADRLAWWSKEIFGSISRRKKRCLARIDGIQRARYARPSIFLFQLEQQLLQELHNILNQEEKYWHQKSKLNWLTQGERNTRYFHVTATSRKRRNTVCALKNESGEWVEDPAALQTLVTEFYKKLYTGEPGACDTEYTYHLPKLSQAKVDILNRPVTEVEIVHAVNQMGANKSPGPDGFSPIFFQQNWDIVGQSVIRFVLETFRTQMFPPHMNLSLITLIPKVECPEEISQFRPISLSNVVVKIISKVIANRLKMVINDLVNPTQCSFIPGRQACDNIIVTQEILHTMRRKVGRVGTMAAKIDLEKAYDRVNWDFLRRVLQEVGFNSEMINLIMFMVTSAKLSVIWNGCRTEPFQPTRGLRQVDPLAPYLFVLCMDLLSQKINQAVELKKWRPICVSRGGPAISHLLFADDLLLFGVATEAQANMMASLMNDFCEASGQKVSTTKSHLYVSATVSSERASILSNRFCIPLTRDLGRYLGMPLLHGRATTATYNYLVEKVSKRLAAWKGRLMSKAARNILIQSVVSAVPYYAMQTASLPTAVIDKIERLSRSFFWGEYNTSRRLHTIAWPVVCRPKAHGGTGIKRLRPMNRALLAKLVWRLTMSEDVLWVKILRAKYGCPLNPAAARKPCTHTWRSILSAAPVVAAGLVGLTDPAASQIDNHAKWKHSSSGHFSVASAYISQMDFSEATPDPHWKKIWALKGPQRGNFLLWQARLNRLPTEHLLFSRQIRDSPQCTHCAYHDSTNLHALRDCLLAKQIWRRVIPEHGRREFFRDGDTVSQWIDRSLYMQQGEFQSHEHWKYIFRETVSAIWMIRNKLQRDEDFSRPDTHSIVDNIFEMVRNIRLAWRQDVQTCN